MTLKLSSAFCNGCRLSWLWLNLQEMISNPTWLQICVVCWRFRFNIRSWLSTFRLVNCFVEWRSQIFVIVRFGIASLWALSQWRTTYSLFCSTHSFTNFCERERITSKFFWSSRKPIRILQITFEVCLCALVFKAPKSTSNSDSNTKLNDASNTRLITRYDLQSTRHSILTWIRIQITVLPALHI